MRNGRQQGFTLVEIMVVVTIIAILGSIAIPAYREYVRRSDRTAAKTALLEDAQYLERTRTMTNKYDHDGTQEVSKDTLPVQYSPKDGTAKYNIVFSDDKETGLTPNKFILMAVPVAGGPMERDKCGTLTINHLGQKGVVGNAEGTTAADCWGR